MLNITGLLGLLGNVMSIIILSRPQMKSSVNCLLIGLASFDTILIFTSILMFGLPAVYTYTDLYLVAFFMLKVFPYITPVVYAVGMIAQTGSVYLTLAVSMERYVAVCQPLKARSLCTFGRSRRVVIGLGLFAVLYNLPRFFEVRTTTAYYTDLGVNVTDVGPTPLRNNPAYVSVYMTWLYLVVMYFLPFVGLTGFNLFIYKQVRQANLERAQLTHSQKKEISLATMLMVVVSVFFICNILALVVNILESVIKVEIIILNRISNLLVTLNSSVNFIIYCIFGDKFKRIFYQLCCPVRANQMPQEFMQRYPDGARTVTAFRNSSGHSVNNSRRHSPVSINTQGINIQQFTIEHNRPNRPNRAVETLRMILKKPFSTPLKPHNSSDMVLGERQASPAVGPVGRNNVDPRLEEALVTMSDVKN